LTKREAGHLAIAFAICLDWAGDRAEFAWERPLKGAGAGDRSRPGQANELSGTVHGSAVQAGSIHGGVHVHQAGAWQMPVPRQLPGAPPCFTSRAGELARLDQVLAADPERPVALAVITGVGGAGKTSLAARWLAGLADRFPDGQLYADLGGSLGTSSSPAAVAGQFLRAIGVQPAQVPAGLAEAAALWRSATAGRQLIVLLDNAVSAAQVRVLLPGPGPSLVAVTSRHRLAGLVMDGAVFTELGPLGERDALALLSKITGGRSEAEPDAARMIVRLCGGLPLAVCVSAARLVLHPGWTVRQVADELRSEQHRLSVLSPEADLSVRAAFDVSYRSLPAAAARSYRALSLLPAPDFGTGLAAAVIGAAPRESAQHLEILTNASLLEEMAGGRFRFHDLVRLHAREQASAGPAAEREAVTRHAVSWYLGEAVAADLVVIPGRWQLGGLYDQARRQPAAFPDQAAALAWLEAELPGLAGAVAAARDAGLHREACQLCEALWGLLLYRRHYPQWIAVTEIGLASARACGDLRAEARMRDQLGFAFLCLRRYDEAGTQLREAVRLARRAGDQLGAAAPLEHQGLTLLGLGQPGEALRLFEEARATHIELGRPRGVALMTRHIGEALADAGRVSEAITVLADARARFAALPDPYNECRAATEVARACLRAGRLPDAAALLEEALQVMTRLGALEKQADIHVLLADAAESRDDSEAARQHLAAALEVYQRLGPADAGVIRERYARYWPGSPQAAADSEQDQEAP
jgi:tetratricopeptide (TPR) repeat protein